MVWLISFLTVSNIALGYGLAVYVQRQFGTALPTGVSWRHKKTEVLPTVETVTQAAVAPSASVSEPTPSQTPKPRQANPTEIKSAETKSTEKAPTPTAIPAEETSGLPPVDEENVLAGIEEFRSQLAKMHVVAEDGDANAPQDVEPEPIAAAN
jgi:hypothetical protein